MSCVLSDQLQKRGESIIDSPHFGRWITFFRQKHAAPAARRRKGKLGWIPFYARSANVNERRADAQASVRCELAQEESLTVPE